MDPLSAISLGKKKWKCTVNIWCQCITKCTCLSENDNTGTEICPIFYRLSFSLTSLSLLEIV